MSEDEMSDEFFRWYMLDCPVFLNVEYDDELNMYCMGGEL